MEPEELAPLDPNFRIQLPVWEGPLDLLLHLIQKHELSILDLPIAFVTERYLEYLSVMEKLDLDVAAEYLVMAATLAHIKSKMLLPPDPSQTDEDAPEEETDPRAELIRRLLEYQKYKIVAEDLGQRGIVGRDVFARGSEPPDVEGPAPLAEVGLFKLLDAFQAVVARTRSRLAFEITAERITIQERTQQILEVLREREAVPFEELFGDVRSVYDVVVTFLALLEMSKRRLASIYQTGPRSPLYVERRVLDVGEAFDVRLEGLDEAFMPPAGEGREERASGIVPARVDGDDDGVAEPESDDGDGGDHESGSAADHGGHGLDGDDAESSEQP